MQTDLTIHNLTLSFGKQPPLLSNLSFHFPANQWTSILGKSGVGKTCLLRIIAGLPDLTKSQFTGQITYQQKPISIGQISYLSQQSSLLPWLSVIDNIVLTHRLRGSLIQEHYEQAEHLLSQMDLITYQHKRPAVLSGGMKQRVQLARILLDGSAIVLLDEPFSALDPITRFAMQTLTQTLLKNKTVLLVTHDPLEALRLSNQIVILSGKPAQLSSPLFLNQDPPRLLNDPALLIQHAQLLQQLTQDHHAV